ncbi:MAG: AMP-binding protein, partial [Oscillospiraceae bacterium]
HLTVADTGWAKAAWGKIFGQWLCEAAVFVYDHDVFNAKDLLAVVSKYKVTSFCAPPTVFRFLIQEDFAPYNLSSMNYVTTAGEPLNAEVFYRFKEKTGLEIRECYGQTEMTPMILTPPYIQPRPGSLGIASPAYRVLLLDEKGGPVKNGEEGEICIEVAPAGLPGVFMGYYRDEALTGSVWKNGIYHTGDKAKRDEDGYFWYIGRADDVIKSSGYRIGPFEVESVLMEHPAVLECAITAVPDPVRGQAVKASIVLAKGYLPSEELKKELQNHVKKTTAPYKYPRVVEFVTRLPKTISGKIQRVVLRRQSSQKENKTGKPEKEPAFKKLAKGRA